jgi:hypothetical protein
MQCERYVQYGNSELNEGADGSGAMEAVNWGDGTWGMAHHGNGSTGPWVMADLEHGLWAGNSSSGKSPNPSNAPIIAKYVTAMLKGRSGHFALKGGDAQKGGLTTMYDGPRPAGCELWGPSGALLNHLRLWKHNAMCNSCAAALFLCSNGL